MDPIVPDTLEDALSLLSACQKYQMDSTATRIRALIRRVHLRYSLLKTLSARMALQAVSSRGRGPVKLRD
jgi:hypothetical protein